MPQEERWHFDFRRNGGRAHLNTTEGLERGVTCPICEADIEISKLAKLGLSFDELNRIKNHILDRTIGQRLRIAEIAMQRMDPERLRTEHQVNDAIIKLRGFVEDVLRTEGEKRVQLREGYEQKGVATMQEIAATIGRLERLWAENQRLHVDMTRDLNEISRKIGGTGIGKVGEIITIRDLKQAVPEDDFDETRATQGGTDIIGTIKENGIFPGTITISVKYTEDWKPSYLEQLAKNMQTDASRFGILVTKAFPKQAISDKAWVTKTREGNSVILVKPDYAPLAYFGLRQATLVWYQMSNLQKAREKESDEMEKVFKSLIYWINGEEFQESTACIDCAISEANKTKDLVSAVKKYVEGKIGEVLGSQDRITVKLMKATGLIRKLMELLNDDSSSFCTA